LGIGLGDRVLIFMPNIIQNAIAMLACARLGAVHITLSSKLQYLKVSKNIDKIKPKLIIGCSANINESIYQQLSKALDITKEMESVENIILYSVETQHHQQEMQIGRVHEHGIGVLDWNELVRVATRDGEYVDYEYTPVDSEHPFHIIHTSGTTDEPKGIVRDTGGYMVSLNYHIRTSRCLRESDMLLSKSDFGWVSGQSIMMYGSLVTGATSILFDGDALTPDPGALWKLIEKYRVNVLRVGLILNQFYGKDPNGEYMKQCDLSSLRLVLCGGEKILPVFINFITKMTGAKVYEGYGSTESGGMIIGNPNGQVNLLSGSTGVPIPGYQLYILDPQGNQCKQGQPGELVIKLPLPPGFTIGIIGKHEYTSSFLKYKGYFTTNDLAVEMENNNINVISRLDSILSINGNIIYIDIYEGILLSHPSVLECIVIPLTNPKYSSSSSSSNNSNSNSNNSSKSNHIYTLGLIVLKEQQVDQNELMSSTVNSHLENQLTQLINNDKLCALAPLRGIIFLTELPKNRVGKIPRRLLTDIFNDKTIDDAYVNIFNLWNGYTIELLRELNINLHTKLSCCP